MPDRPVDSPQRRGGLGQHVLIDGWRASAAVLDDADGVATAVEQAVQAADSTLVNLCVHRFNPHGVTVVATLAESHLAVHTWPELGYFAADLFFCGRGDPRRAVDSLAEALGAGDVRIRTVARGVGLAAKRVKASS